MIQHGLFDWRNRLRKIDTLGDPLVTIKQAICWEMFRPALEKAHDKNCQSNLDGPVKS